MRLWESGRTVCSKKVSLNPCITAGGMAGIAAYGLMVIVIRRHVSRPEIGSVGRLGQEGAQLRIEIDLGASCGGSPNLKFEVSVVQNDLIVNVPRKPSRDPIL
jgi:hypothetical protein